MSPLLIKISKDFATLWTTIDPIGNVALFAGLTAALTRFARCRGGGEIDAHPTGRDGFAARSISHRFPRARFFTVLPAQPELGDISEAESADYIVEKIDIGFVEVGLHDRAFCPINQSCLAEFPCR